MQPTKLLYLEDGGLLVAEAQVLEVREEAGKMVVVLDQTVFYPQGGGQPYDTGTIKGSSGVFIVDEVRFVDGVVLHKGAVQKASIAAGDTVQCSVDEERRQLHRRLHSAGHVLDMAVAQLSLPWIPGKGYHFPDGPYVEYTGSLEGVDKDAVARDIEKIANSFVAEDRLTTLRFMAKEDMHTVCRHVPDYLPPGKPARVVMYGDFGVPCGGTHVGHLGEIGTMKVEKIKSKGPTIRVSYRVH